MCLLEPTTNSDKSRQLKNFRGLVRQFSKFSVVSCHLIKAMFIIYLLPVVLCLLYAYWTRNHDYWAKRNVKHDRPLPFFGNHLLNFLLRRSRPDIGMELYNKYKGEKFVGYYTGNKLELIVRDPEIMKRIFNSDFEYFTGRGKMGDLEKNPLLRNVIFVDGEEWRKTRARFTPAFSPSRLRTMFPLLQQCTEHLKDTMSKISDHEEIKTFDLMSCYTLECIGNAGFGIDLNALNAEYSEFIKLSHSFFIRTKLQVFLMVFAELLPEGLFKPKLVNQELEDVLYSMTRNILEERGFRPSGRNDIMDAILKMDHDAPGQTTGSSGKDIDFITAQLFSILFGGYETTAFSISYTLHQLAYHSQIQENVQSEIDLVMSSNKGKLTYESIAQMPNLEMAWKESMRLFSPFSGVTRVCEKRYTIPGTDVTIDPGVKVIFPCQALQLDAEYFENPNEFQPERFSSGAEGKFGLAYPVFGDGHRKCLGLRLAELMALSALAVVLHNFSVAPGPASKPHPLRKNNPIQIQNVEGGLPLRFIPRNSQTP